jgi:alginate O-acetyltransferase complex protein AlgI
MLFNSYFFIFSFLPLALIGYFTLNHFKYVALAKTWLIGASLYFYTYYSFNNLPILALSLITNYFIGHSLHSELKWISRKNLFRFGLVFNITLLSLFKYSGFLLPLGLSFYTLQQVAFLIDSYEGLAEEKSFLDYAVFVCFFPTLISGPIVHYQLLMPQIASKENKRFNVDLFSTGIFLFCIGLLKKVLISEVFASWAKPGFDEALSLDLLAAWKTSLSYLFQLYYDFSGYTDMAIGIGYMFNVKLPQNFNSPFRSKSIIEFWSRWHMTLSQFINTYLFTPIVRAMPKITFKSTMFATFTAMFIAGIWHGAGMTFVVYGALHGLALVVNHMWKKRKKKLPPFMAWFLTFNFVNITFVVFRAKELDSAWKVLKGMLGLTGVVIPKILIKSVGPLKEFGFKMGTYLQPTDYSLILMVCGAFYLVLKAKSSLELEKEFKPQTKIAVACGLGFVFCFFGMNRITEFIYFNF